MIRNIFMAGAVMLAAMVAGHAPVSADSLEDIKKKGTLVVGTKADYPPYGFLNPQGQIVGLEPDMAADVAKRLGVKLELVPVVASNRMQFLEQGKIDLVIATMTDNEDRRKVVGIIEPSYYASGVAILANKAAKINSAADLKDKPVCAIQGAFYNNRLQSEFTGRDLVAFKGVPENEQALLGGRCVGFVYDDVLLIYKKQTEGDKWKDYEVIVLEEWQPAPWGLAVKLSEKDGAWGKFMADTVKDWLASGTLLELEKKWLGQNTKWLQEASAKAKQ